MVPSTTRATASTRSDTNLVRPEWDTSDHTLPLFVSDLIKWLKRKDRRYERLVRSGTILSGRYTIYLSLNHIDRIATASVTPGTFAKPCTPSRAVTTCRA